MSAILTANQRRTARAREAFAAKFPDDDAKRNHFRQLSEQAAERRIVLNGDDVAALSAAYRLLDRIAERHPRISAPSAIEPAPVAAPAPYVPEPHVPEPIATAAAAGDAAA